MALQPIKKCEITGQARRSTSLFDKLKKIVFLIRTEFFHAIFIPSFDRQVKNTNKTYFNSLKQKLFFTCIRRVNLTEV